MAKEGNSEQRRARDLKAQQEAVCLPLRRRIGCRETLHAHDSRNLSGGGKEDRGFIYLEQLQRRLPSLVYPPEGCSGWARRLSRSPMWMAGPRHLGPLLLWSGVEQSGHELAPHGMPASRMMACMGETAVSVDAGLSQW